MLCIRKGLDNDSYLMQLQYRIREYCQRQNTIQHRINRIYLYKCGDG